MAIETSLPVCRRLEDIKPVPRDSPSNYAIWSRGARLAKRARSARPQTKSVPRPPELVTVGPDTGSGDPAWHLAPGSGDLREGHRRLASTASEWRWDPALR